MRTVRSRATGRQDPPPVDWSAVEEHLAAINRDTGPIVLALFPNDRGRPCIHLRYDDPSEIDRREVERILRRSPDLSLGLILGVPAPVPPDWGDLDEHYSRRPDGSRGRLRAFGASNAHIASVPIAFAEGDGGLPIEEQERLPARAGLPEPTIATATGGKSLHLQWVMTPGQELAPAQYREIERRLALALRTAAPDAGIDESLSNPSRVMRLAGGLHPSTGRRASIHSRTGETFTFEDLDAVLPPLPEPESPSRSSSSGTGERAAAGSTDDSRRAVAMLEVLGPEDCPTYNDWLEVGMMLHHTDPGLVDAWVDWSRRFGDDYDEVECREKWETFGRGYGGQPKTIASLHKLAKPRGYREPKRNRRASPRSAAPEPRRQSSGRRDDDPPAADPDAPTAASEQDDDGETFDPDRDLDHTVAREHVANSQTTIDLRDVLHPWLAERLIRRAQAFPLDPLWLLGPGLAACAALVGTRARVEIKRGWSEPLVLWIANVADASSLKSAAINVWQAPLIRIEVESREAHRRALKELQEGEEAPPPPSRWLAADATYEAIATLAAAPQNHGLLSFQDELSGWFANLERQCSAGARAGWLSLWTGSALIVDRKTSESLFRARTAVSLCGAVQPDKLAGMMASTGDGDVTAGDGLWPRFLWVRPPRVPFRFVEDEAEITDDLHRLLERVHQVPPPLADDAPAAMRFEPEAIAAMAPFWAAWDVEAGGSAPARNAFLGKLRGYSARLAGVLALIDAACDGLDRQLAMTSFFRSERTDRGSRWILPVTASHAERALQLALFFLAQFDRIQNELGHGDLPPEVAKLLARAQENGGEPVTATQVGRWKLPERGATSKQAGKWLRDVVVGRYGLGEISGGSRRDQVVWAP